jgi:hypothetical protein
MKQLSVSFLIAVSIVQVTLWGCANQKPPEGGPVDMTPPVIISIYPDSNKLNFSDNKIKLEFDRYVEERTLEESIFISPYVGTLEFDWSGTEVEITFSEKLRRNTTYVVNIGTDVQDKYRGKMRMAKAYSLAFSTGPDIDRGGIEGLVFPFKRGDALSGIMIFAYQLDGLNLDTLNPETAKPDFITQTGKNGDFFLHHIPFGNYRLFAVRDEYRNLVYDREVDEYGVPSSLIHISQSDTLATGILMQLAKEDTSGPMLVKAAAFDRNHVASEFSEPLDPSSITLGSFEIADTTDRKPLEVITVYPNPLKPKSMIAVTQKQDSTKTYYFQVQNVTDSAGNKINPLANSLVFQGSSKADTIGPRLLDVSIKDSIRNIVLQPVFTLTFYSALAKKTSLDFLTLLDKNKQQVRVKKKRLSDVLFSIVPDQQLSNRTWYSLRAELRGIYDWKDSTCKDSTKEWRFETLDIEDMSSVEGTVVDLNSTDTVGRLYVTASQIGERNPNSYSVAADAKGRFIFPIVAEGQYAFQAFRDRNNNGLYDSGKPFPFVFSERLSSVSDTLKVRARWPLEGVKILMK